MLQINSNLLTIVLVIAFLSPGCMLHKKIPTISKPEMVFIKGGTFMMGDVVEQLNDDALPLHQVKLENYYIGKYEVTYSMYDEFAKLTDRPLPDDNDRGRGDRAVVRISWEEALAYCNHFGYRLPSETEWEYAAREGGKNTLYSGTNSTDSLKYYAITEVTYSFYVGSKTPNAFGIYDMSGNVAEWIGSYYQFYEKPAELHDLENSSVRIIRGGSFSGESMNTTKNFWRVGVLSSSRYYNIGFRCVASAGDL